MPTCTGRCNVSRKDRLPSLAAAVAAVGPLSMEASTSNTSHTGRMSPTEGSPSEGFPKRGPAQAAVGAAATPGVAGAAMLLALLLPLSVAAW